MTERGQAKSRLCVMPLQKGLGDSNVDADMISTAGNYLINTLTAASYMLKCEEVIGWSIITIAVSVAVVVVGYYYRRR